MDSAHEAVQASHIISHQVARSANYVDATKCTITNARVQRNFERKMKQNYLCIIINIANISLVELVSGRFSRNVRIFFFTIILDRGLKLQRKIKANQNTPTNCMIQTTQLVFFNRIAENLWKTLGKFLLVILSSVLAGKLLIII